MALLRRVIAETLTPQIVCEREASYRRVADFQRAAVHKNAKHDSRRVIAGVIANRRQNPETVGIRVLGRIATALTAVVFVLLATLILFVAPCFVLHPPRTRRVPSIRA
jgi:hypothetical protein